MNSSDLRRFVTRFINNKYEDAVACFFFGSGNSSNLNEGSDLDNIVLMPTNIQPTHEHHVLAGWLFDIYVLNEACLERIIDSQLSKHIDYFTNALLDSTVLIDRNQTASRVLGSVRSKLEALPPFLDWLPLRLSITALVRDAKYSCTSAERTAACLELYVSLLKCWTLSNGQCMGSAKHMALKMMRADAKYSEDLRLAYFNALQDRSERFIEIAEAQLDLVGGPFDSGDKIYLSDPWRHHMNERRHAGDGSLVDYEIQRKKMITYNGLLIA